MSKTSTFKNPFAQKNQTHLVFDRLIRFAEAQCLIKKNQTIIIGLSGGPDSVFLFYFFLQMRETHNLNLIAAHLDHQWRTNSADDVEFCKKLAEQYNVPFVSTQASKIKISKKNSGSQEEMGRLLRRAFFSSLYIKLQRTLCDTEAQISIALAHHADDQQETFFIRLLRGSGLTGLTGIKSHDGIYIHPLLCLYKQEIMQILEENKIKFLIDPTNQSDQFLRNRIRLYLMPALRQCDERVDMSIARTMQNLQEADDFLQQTIKKQFEDIVKKETGKLWLAYKKLLLMHPFVQKQLLLHWFIIEKVTFTPSAAFFEEVLRFLKNIKSKEHTFYKKVGSNCWKIHKKASQATIIFENK